MPDPVDPLVQLSLQVVARLTRIGSAHDLSLTQLRLLGILRDREPPMAGLAEHLGLDRSSISGLVDRAAGRGLVERFPDAVDQRSTRVRLTDRGRELTDAMTSEVEAAVGALLEPLPTAERRRLGDLLVRVVE